MKERELSTDVLIASTMAVKEKEYWLEKLSGLTDRFVKSVFPYDRWFPGEKAEPQLKKSQTTFSISREVSSRLVELSKGLDYAVHMILTAVVGLLLHKYTGNKDIILGAPIYKQENADESQFVNTVLPLRNQPEEKMTFKEYLLQVQKTITEAEENQNYPLETLLYHLDMQASHQEFPLFDVAVLLENIHHRTYIQHIPLNMIFCFKRREDSVEGVVEYNSCLYRPGTIIQLVNHFACLLERFLEDVNKEIAAAELLSEEEKQRLLRDFNDTAREYPDRKTIAELFAEQVERAPHHIAVVAVRQSRLKGTTGNMSITYGELNKWSNRLAHLLRAKGVRPDTLVGIMTDRTIDTIVGIIAILKAGGAYLPIDPEAPVTRIASILEDARVSIVLAGSPMLEKFIFTTLQGLRRFKNKPFVTSPRAPIRDLDGLPYPDRSLIDYGKYNQYIGQSMARDIIVLQASRGCPYHCVYCHKIWPKKHVVRSAEHIFSEVNLNFDMGMRKFAFVDDIFNLDRKNSIRFFQLIIEKGLNREVQFYFPNGVRGDILTKEYIDLMVEAGTVSCALALETASPRLQKLLKKNLDLEKFRENIEYFCNKHPNVILELFTMHGFPSETEEEAFMTLNFIKSLKWVHFPYINMLKIYPNTDMERLAIRHGVTRESIFRSENYAHFQVSDNSPLEKSFTLNYRSDFLYNYFLLKERLLHVLPHQMKVLTRDEIIQKYNSYLPTEVTGFEDLLKYLGIKEEELKVEGRLQLLADSSSDFHLRWKRRNRELAEKPSANALKVLLLDLSQFFTGESDFFYDVMGEAPLGMLYLLTYLNHRFGSKINGKIAKSRIDFDSCDELKTLLEEFQPHVIGLRSLNIYKDFFHRTLSIIRQWGIDVPIIAGGPYATSDMNTVLQDKHVDLVVRGEGEITFSEVIETIMNNNGQLPAEEELKKIPGIAFIPKESGETGDSDRSILMIDVLETRLSGEPAGNLTHINRANDLAYSIFTSGSTGKPKGVMIRHRSVHNLVLGLNERIYKQYHGYLKVGLVSPFVFDASVKQVFGALLQGHGLCIVPEEVRADLEQLYEFYKTHSIDISDGTPAYINMLTEAMKESSLDPGVKHFLIGGETLSPKAVEDFFNGFTPGSCTPKIANVYGPTECTVDSTCYQISEENIGKFPCIPIGTPMPNCQVFILDRRKDLVPVGVSGELCIGGDGVGRGYLNNPELTVEKFISIFYRSYKSYMTYISKRIYRTGDLARWLPGGSIQFLGRIDLQVKIRGYRIELEEIEKHLQTHKKIKDAVIAARKDMTGNVYLCAYIVVAPVEILPDKNHPAKEVDAAELKEYLEQEVPFYMIPSHFVRVESIPLTSTGKVDRSALPDPGVGTGMDTLYAPPGNEVEEKLVELWSQLLGIDPGIIGINANFFELGGHSLRATILITRIHRIFGIKIPLAEIFKTPAIKGLAVCISQVREKTYAPIAVVKKKDYYKLTPAQERLYFEQQMDEQSTTYVISSAAELEGKLDKKRLEDTFMQLIKRHESLRTSFSMVGDEPMLRVHDEDLEFEIDYYDMKEVEVKVKVEEERSPLLEGTRGLAPLPIESAARSPQPAAALINSFIRPFDLSKPPLLRVRLIALSSMKHLLLANVHHIAADGTSVGIIMKDFMELYKGSELPGLRLQYKDYAEWKNSEEQIKLMENQGKFWLALFKGDIPVLNLPTDYPRPRLKSSAGWVTRSTMGPEKTRQLKELALTTDTTLYMVLFAIYNLLLHKLSGDEDIVVGTPLAGRRHADLLPIAGMFVNTLVLRNHVDQNKTFIQFLKDIKTQTLHAFENQEFSFENLVSQVVTRRDTGRHPLFDVFFALQNMEIPEIEIPGLKLKPYEENLKKVSRFDMSFILTEMENRMLILVEYCTALFKEETIKMFIKNFNQVISAVIENRDIQIKDITTDQGFLEVKGDMSGVEFGFEKMVNN